ncbi:MAG: hypothetical protein LBS89_07985 [Zoogloeaceae bacterium]|jgi:hypothetical protein|nr:hypothetical protein [Zoogloeaceae bacterium]
MKKRAPPVPKTPREICRQLFGNPEPPAEVWEKQFDYCYDELEKLAHKDWRLMDENDLGIYLLDLKYVEPLQPDLFRYLFPVCLALWQECLMQERFFEGEACTFLDVLQRGNLFERMMTFDERQAVQDFMSEALIRSLGQPRRFASEEVFWMHTLTNFGALIPKIPEVWTRWWTFDLPGKAVAALMFASLLMYSDTENPIFRSPRFVPRVSKVMDYRFDEGWLEPNLAFLHDTLTVDYLQTKIAEAATVLQHEPEGKLAARLVTDAKERQDIIPIFIEDLLTELRYPDSPYGKPRA